MHDRYPYMFYSYSQLHIHLFLTPKQLQRVLELPGRCTPDAADMHVLADEAL